MEGNRFFSDQTTGAFVLYPYKGRFLEYIKLNNPPNRFEQDDSYEIGPKQKGDIAKYYRGKFFKTIFEVIPEETLRKYTLEELRIMRNEIFARYGYVFKKNGEMDIYFKQQEWYQAHQRKVAPFFTNIEKKNLKNIRKIEGQKRRL